MKWSGLCLCLWAAALVGVRAAEFEFLDVDTFIDPFLFVARETNTVKLRDKYHYFSSRLYYGIEANYQYRNDFAKASSAVVRSANNYYVAPLQLAVDITGRQPFQYRNSLERDKVPAFKTRVEVSYYHEFSLFEKKGTNANSSDNVRRRELLIGESFWTRFQLGWNLEETRRPHQLVHEFTVEYEVQFLPEKFLHGFIESETGGYIYAWKPELDDQFAGYLVRLELFRWPNGSNLKYGVGIGAEARSSNWQWGAFRNEFTLEIAKVWKLGTLNVSYGLTEDVNSGSWHQQASVFLDVSVFSALTSPKGK